MNHASVLFGISIGVPLLVAALGTMVAMRSGLGEAVNSPPRGASILFGVGLLLMLLIPMTAFSGEIMLLKAALLLTGAFAVVGVVFGLRASGALKKRSV